MLEEYICKRINYETALKDFIEYNDYYNNYLTECFNEQSIKESSLKKINLLNLRIRIIIIVLIIINIISCFLIPNIIILFIIWAVYFISDKLCSTEKYYSLINTINKKASMKDTLYEKLNKKRDNYNKEKKKLEEFERMLTISKQDDDYEEYISAINDYKKLIEGKTLDEMLELSFNPKDLKLK